LNEQEIKKSSQIVEEMGKNTPTRAKNSKNIELMARARGGRREIKDWNYFVPVVATNRDLRQHICPD